MRLVLLLVTVVAFCVCVIAGMYLRIDSLCSKIKHLEHEISSIERARDADKAAFSAAMRAREDAELKAKERRDALQVPPDATDNDVLDICRGSLCTKQGDGGADSASGAANSMPAASDARRAEKR